MRTLTRHEKKLTLFLGLAVAAGIHLLLLKVALSLDQTNRRNLTRVTDELAEAKSWIEQKDLWTQRITWLSNNLKPMPADNPAPGLQKIAQNAADTAKLKIEEQNLSAARTGASCTIVGNRMRLTGSLEQFTRWCGLVYQPEKGVAVISLSLKLSPEPPKMTGEAEVGGFFRSKNQ